MLLKMRDQQSWTRPIYQASGHARWYLRLSSLKSRLDRAGHAVVTVAAALAAMVAGGCRESPVAATVPPLPPADGGGTDITFFVAADTHFGVRGMEEMNRRQIEGMHALPGRPWPVAEAGAIAEPLGVLIAGDLTERGRGEEWEQLVAHYGLSGGDGLLKWPVHEATGNHDRPYSGCQQIAMAVARRHGGLPYSLQWQGVRVICLDVYPNEASREHLRRELELVGREAPVVLYFHYGLIGPYSDWWSRREKRAFLETIRGHNILGIFHGHFHATAHYKWNGFDVYNVGSPRHGWRSFCVVRITDDYMITGSWNYLAGAWDWWHIKPISRAARVSEHEEMPALAAR
jgi:hypothetical protein